MRITLSDLKPQRQYALEFQAVGINGDLGEWSPKFNLVTDAATVIPAAPTNVTWVSNGDNFHGEWTPVTVDVDGEPIKVDRYEIELTGQPGSVVAFDSEPQKTSGKVLYDLSFEENVARFLSVKGTIAIRVRAFSTKNVPSAWSSSVSAGNQPPAAPTGFAATANFEYIDTKWNAVTEADLAGYKLYLSTNGAGGTYNVVYTGAETNYSFPSSMYTTDHYFYVKAFDKFGLESSASATAGPVKPKNAFAVDTVPPDVPTSLSGTITNAANGIGATMNVTWSMTAPADLTGFNVRWRKVGDTSYQQTTVDKETRAVTLNLEKSYTNYEIQIRAFDSSANYSAWSSTVTVNSPANAAPSAVSGLAAQAGRDNIVYTWTPVPDTDIDYYELTFSTSSTFASGNTTFRAAGNSVSVSGLSQNTPYYARIRAVDVTGLPSSAWSSTVSATTGSFPSAAGGDGTPPPSSPTPTVSGGLGYLAVTWTAVTNQDLVTYDIHVSTTSDFTVSGSTKITEVNGTFAIVDILPNGTPLLYDTTYYVKIVARDRDGSAAPSAQASGTLSKVGNSDVSQISVDKLIGGTIAGQEFIVGTNGSIKSADYNTTTPAGWIIKRTGIELLDSNSKVSAAALQGGTISATSQIILGPNANLIVNGGYIQSNTYTAGSAGFRIGTSGIEMNDSNSSISVAALKTGTISAATITLSGANAKITGTGFELSGSGLTVTNGSIAAAAITLTSQFSNDVGASMTTIDGGIIKTGSIQSQTTTTVGSATVPTWSIPLNGSASFANLTVRGVTTLGVSGDAANSHIKSANWSGVGGAGWYMDASGNLYANSGTFGGNLNGATGTFSGSLNGASGTFTGSLTGNTIQTSSASTYVVRMNSTSFKIIGADSANPLLDFSTGTNSLTIGANAVFKGSLNGATGTFSGNLSGATISGGSVTMGSTSAGGERIVLRADGTGGILEFYTGLSGESAPSKIDPSISSLGNIPTLTLETGTTSTNGSPASIRITSGTGTSPGQGAVNITGNLTVSGTINATLNGINTQSVTLTGTTGALNMNGLNVNSVNSLNNSGGTIGFIVANGKGKVSGGANVGIRFGQDPSAAGSAAAVTLGATTGTGAAPWVASTTDNMNASTPTSANTVDFWGKTIRGFGTYVNASDAREKNTIEPVDGEEAINIIKGLQIKSYKMNNVEPDRTQYGVIAQEARYVMPSAVTLMGSRWGVSYQDIWAMNLVVTQKLLEKVETLEQNNLNLEARLDELAAIVQGLTSA